MSELFEGSDQSGAAVRAPGLQDVLVGPVGQDVFKELMAASANPAYDVAEFQRRAGLPEAECKPLLQLADRLKLRRAEVYQAVYLRAKEVLLARLPSMSTDALMQLLDACFQYIHIKDLQEIPFKVLELLSPVPATYLTQLAEDDELFEMLPYSVQRQVWEKDKKLLQQHVVALVNAYIYEADTLNSLLDIDDTLPTIKVFKRAGLQAASRRSARESSAVLQKLASMVGTSRQVYRGCVELVVARFADTIDVNNNVTIKDAGLCALRSQLLMALHDNGANDLCSAERVHKLPWTMDAAHKDRALDERRLKELKEFFQPFDYPDTRRQSIGRNKYLADNDADSAACSGVPQTGSDDPQMLLGHAAMALRDPSILFFLAHAVCRHIIASVNKLTLPREDPDLVFITRLIQLATIAKRAVRERITALPAASSVMLEHVYPILANHLVLSQMRALGVKEELPDISTLRPMLAAVLKDECAQVVVHVCALERGAAGDLKGLELLLEPLSDTMAAQLRNQAQAAAFSYTLAKRLLPLVTARKLLPNQHLFDLAVKFVLLKCVDLDPLVHLQILQLILAAAPDMTKTQLVECLEEALHNSRKSRKRSKKQSKRQPHAEHLETVSSCHSITSASPGPLAKSLAIADSEMDHLTSGHQELRAIYNKFTVGFGLEEDNAASLFAYLNQQP